MTTMGMNESSAAPKPGTRPVAVGMTPDNYAFLQRYIYDESGIVLDEDKRYLLESRLQPIALEQKIESLNALALMLQAKPSSFLGRLVVEAMTTHETLFFRDRLLFE